MSEPGKKRWTFQFPLWALLFVLPTIAAFVSGYFLLAERIEKEIAAQLQFEKEKKLLREHKQAKLRVLQDMGRLTEESADQLTSPAAVWRRLVEIRLHAPWVCWARKL